MIYADNAATTMLSETALAHMLPFLRERYANASSSHSFGGMAMRAIGLARGQIARAVSAKPEEIYFTSGGTEANSWVLRSVTERFPNQSIHIVTSAIEHYSVLNGCRALEKRGVEVTYLPVNHKGFVSFESVKEAVRPNTRLVTVMLANNEIGTIQPIGEIGRHLRDIGVLFHTDAVQAVGRIPVDVNALHVDYLSASAHKFNGAKGTGFLYQRAGKRLPPLLWGGKQEFGARPGTENVAGVVAAGYALEECVMGMEEVALRIKRLVDITTSILRRKIFDAVIYGGAPKLPGIITLGFAEVSGESLSDLLGLKEIYVSSGSACASRAKEPSHVLFALGIVDENAPSALRISYGRHNTENEAETLAHTLCNIYQKIVHSKAAL